MKRNKIKRSLLNPSRLFSIIILWLMGWKTRCIPLDLPKYVLIGAPHTSNWDFVIGYMIMTAIGLKLYWVGKHTIFRRPFGWLMNLMGGIPVDRTRSTNFVDQIVMSFQESDKLIVAIAPEGTRGWTEYWKSGFYYIALKAEIPIILGYVDYARKMGGFEKIIIPSGNLPDDQEHISEFYQTITAKFPENFGPVRFRSQE
ncbi:MAG: lysophospholipid acyltransferase family protein [bacterium]|nr:MAG: lysophospholipid acyltransferase family protein [bacterium]